MSENDIGANAGASIPPRDPSLVGFVGRALAFVLGQPGLGLGMALAVVLQLFYLLFLPLGLEALLDKGLLRGDSHVVWTILAIAVAGFLGHAGATLAQEFVGSRLATRALIGLR